MPTYVTRHSFHVAVRHPLSPQDLRACQPDDSDRMYPNRTAVLSCPGTQGTTSLLGSLWPSRILTGSHNARNPNTCQHQRLRRTSYLILENRGPGNIIYRLSACRHDRKPSCQLPSRPFGMYSVRSVLCFVFGCEEEKGLIDPQLLAPSSRRV